MMFSTFTRSVRKKRICHICGQAYINVTHHRKKHPDVPKEEFYYDTYQKVSKKGKYKAFVGYKCCLCNIAIQNYRSHVAAKYPEIAIKSEKYLELERRSEIESSMNKLINGYKEMLAATGVGKRCQTTQEVAQTYAKQISSIIHTVDDMKYPSPIYQNLLRHVASKGAQATRYAYLATLQNFLQYLLLAEPNFQTEDIQILQRDVLQWLQKQRKDKAKRELFVKQKSRRRLSDLPFPFAAVTEYESKHSERITKIQNQKVGCLKKNLIEQLYGDVFVKLICKLGCRPSVLRGMKVKELNDAEETPEKNWSLLIEEQKEKTQHGCIVISFAELSDIKCASKHAWSYLKTCASENDYVFPSLTDKRKLRGSTFTKIFSMTSAHVFGEVVSATEVRKLITTYMRHQPKEIQAAVARAEGHSVLVAERHYDVSHPHELVEAARAAMQNLAAEGNFIDLIVAYAVL